MAETMTAVKKQSRARSGGTTYTYRVEIERDEDGRYVVECPALEGCYTEGRTFEEAMELIKDAIKTSIESRLALGEDIPVQRDHLFTSVTVTV